VKRILHSNIFFSALIVTFIFAIFLALCKPVINSDDDFYALYTLSGGYGNQPTNILHYHYGWNPFLFWPIAELIRWFPDFNWYTFFLLILQLIACVNLLYLFSLLFKREIAVIIFLLFFFFFQTQFLQSLNYTNTSFILAISGLSSFLFYFSNTSDISSTNKKALIIPFLLLLFSGLLRLHALGLYVLLSIEVSVFVMTFYNFKKFIVLLFFLGVALLASITAHNYYYKTKIPHIQEEEKFRQSFFYLANHLPVSKTQDTGITQIKNSFIQSCFLYDTSFINSKDLETYSQKKIHSRVNQAGENLSALYWFFMNTRVYLLLFGIILFTFIALKKIKNLCKWLAGSLLSLLTLAILLFFFKLTAGIFITIASSMFIAGIFLLRNEKLNNSLPSPFLPLLLLLSSAWMIIRIKKTNDACIKNIEVTRGLLNELIAHKTILFIHSDEFNDNGFYIWDTPAQYPVTNLVNKELILTNSYSPVLQRFKIKDVMKSLPDNPNVFVAGPDLPLLKDYYLLNKGLHVELTKVDGFRYLRVYKIKKQPGN